MSPKHWRSLQEIPESGWRHRLQLGQTKWAAKHFNTQRCLVSYLLPNRLTLLSLTNSITSSTPLRTNCTAHRMDNLTSPPSTVTWLHTCLTSASHPIRDEQEQRFLRDSQCSCCGFVCNLSLLWQAVAAVQVCNGFHWRLWWWNRGGPDLLVHKRQRQEVFSYGFSGGVWHGRHGDLTLKKNTSGPSFASGRRV